jgi:hypothetical protein
MRTYEQRSAGTRQGELARLQRGRFRVTLTRHTKTGAVYVKETWAPSLEAARKKIRAWIA